jgi:UDP-glucose 4-epimerase
MSAQRKKDVYLVIGGSGFLGRHIVQDLLDRGDSVSVFDIVQRYHDVPFYSGDLADQDSVAQALQKVRTCHVIDLLPPIDYIEWCNLHHPHRVTSTWCRPRHILESERGGYKSGHSCCPIPEGGQTGIHEHNRGGV